jgi:sigma-E factor negative regulatory protein RseC
MLTETGRVVAVDGDALWVETINSTACGSCAAKPGCGQSLLAKWASRPAYLKVALAGRDPLSFKIGDMVTIGIPEDVIVTSSMLMYCLPIILMLVGAAFGHYGAGSEGVSALMALAGLLLGGMGVKLVAATAGRSRRLEPVLVDFLASGPSVPGRISST